MRIILIILVFLSIVGCTNTTKDNEPTMMQETKQILNDYPDTLESSIKDAKKVTEQYNQNGKELEESLKASKIN